MEKAMRYVIQGMAGAFAGVVMMIPGLLVGTLIAALREDFLGGMAGLGLGYLIGVPIGVILAGWLREEPGSIGLALLGAFVSFGLMLLPVLLGLENVTLPTIGIFVLTPILATAGYNLRDLRKLQALVRPPETPASAAPADTQEHSG